MIDTVLVTLKNRLNNHLKLLSSPGIDNGSTQDQVVFLSLEQAREAASFPLGAITLLLCRIEQETAGRQGDPYLRTAADGTSLRVHPRIDLNLHLLFVARFKDYEFALKRLSQIIRFFQQHRTFNNRNTPELTDPAMEFSVEWLTLTPSQQNELWSLLRTAYLPSVAYKVRTLAFIEDDPGTDAPRTEGVEVAIKEMRP